jgi:hypothetical protein
MVVALNRTASGVEMCPVKTPSDKPAASVSSNAAPFTALLNDSTTKEIPDEAPGGVICQEQFEPPFAEILPVGEVSRVPLMQASASA